MPATGTGLQREPERAPALHVEGNLLATGWRTARLPDHEHPRSCADEISRYPDIKTLGVRLAGNNRRSQFWAGELKGPMPKLPGFQRLRGEPRGLLQQERSGLGRRTGLRAQLLWGVATVGRSLGTRAGSAVRS